MGVTLASGVRNSCSPSQRLYRPRSSAGPPPTTASPKTCRTHTWFAAASPRLGEGVPLATPQRPLRPSHSRKIFRGDEDSLQHGSPEAMSYKGKLFLVICWAGYLVRGSLNIYDGRLCTGQLSLTELASNHSNFTHTYL